MIRLFVFVLGSLIFFLVKVKKLHLNKLEVFRVQTQYLEKQILSKQANQIHNKITTTKKAIKVIEARQALRTYTFKHTKLPPYPPAPIIEVVKDLITARLCLENCKRRSTHVPTCGLLIARASVIIS